MRDFDQIQKRIKASNRSGHYFLKGLPFLLDGHLSCASPRQYSGRNLGSFERAFQYERTRRKTTFFTIILFSTARTDTNKDVVVVFFDDEGVVQDVAFQGTGCAISRSGSCSLCSSAHAFSWSPLRS